MGWWRRSRAICSCFATAWRWSAVRAMARASDPRERARRSRPRPGSTRPSGWLQGCLSPSPRWASRGWCSTASSRVRHASAGRPGRAHGVGIAATVYLDALRAERRFVLAAGAESWPWLVYLAVMVTLIFEGASLGPLIAASGAIPLLSGSLCALIARPRGSRRASPQRPRARDGDRSYGGLAARDRAVQPFHLRLRTDCAGCVPHPRGRGPVRRSGARPQPPLRAGRCACGAVCRPHRATWSPATNAGSGSWRFGEPATRSRCSCPCA